MCTFPWPPSLFSRHGHCAWHLSRLWACLHVMVTAHVQTSIPLSCFRITATAHGHFYRLWTCLHDTDNCTCAHVHSFAMLSSHGHCVSAHVVTSEHWYKIQSLHMYTEHSYWEWLQVTDSEACQSSNWKQLLVHLYTHLYTCTLRTVSNYLYSDNIVFLLLTITIQYIYI